MPLATPVKPAKAPKPATKAVQPGTTLAVKPPASANIVAIQDALKAQAAGMEDRINPATGIKIRVGQDKKFTLPNGEKTHLPLSLVIVDFITTHDFYENGYDKDNIVPPGCFAIGLNPKKMAPEDYAPNIQAENCQVCPMNMFGSAGTGKACKNGRMLAVLPPDADEDTPLWLLQVSPTALKGFDAYVASVARMTQMPPIAMITTVGFNDSVDYASLEFSSPTPNPLLEVAYGRQDEARALLMAKRDVSGWQPPEDAAPAKKAPAKKAPFRKPAAR